MELQNIAIPILPSRSLAATVGFYKRLGFVGGVHAADSNYAILCKGTVELHFFVHSTLVPSASSAGCYLRVTDVGDWYQSCLAATLPRQGIPRLTPLEDKPWGLREFAVIDPDGTLLRIGQVVEDPSSAPRR